MQGYATAEQLSPERRLRHLDPAPRPRSGDEALDRWVVDALLGRLADLVVERLTERTTDPTKPVEEWLDARGAAEYLGIHRDTLRKLAAERVVPVHQEGPGCKLYFRRHELDDWRRGSRASRLRAIS